MKKHTLFLLCFIFELSAAFADEPFRALPQHFAILPLVSTFTVLSLSRGCRDLTPKGVAEGTATS